MADAKSIWDLEEFKGLKRTFQERNRYFDRWESYYNGTMYKRLRGSANLNRIMQNNVSALFLPLARAVGLDVALVPGRWELRPEAQQFRDPLWALFRASRWRTEGNLYIHNGATMGHSFIRIIDDWDNQDVYLQAFRPDAVLPVYDDPYSREMGMAIVITTVDPTVEAIPTDAELGDKGVEIAEVIERNRIRTYINGQPAALMGMQATRDNPLGFVPFVECRFIDSGQRFGEPTYKRSTQALDRVNELASYLHLIIKRHAEPQWAILGDVQPTDLEKSGENVWIIPGGADVQAIVAQIDIQGVQTFIDGILGEMKDSLPELNISKLVGVERVAAATVELQMSEATAKIRRIRDSVDGVLEEAIRMAGRAGEIMRVPDVAVLNDPALEFNRQRPVFDLDRLTELQVVAQMQSNELIGQQITQQQMLLGDGSTV